MPVFENVPVCSNMTLILCAYLMYETFAACQQVIPVVHAAGRGLTTGRSRTIVRHDILHAIWMQSLRQTRVNTYNLCASLICGSVLYDAQSNRVSPDDR